MESNLFTKATTMVEYQIYSEFGVWPEEYNSSSDSIQRMFDDLLNLEFDNPDVKFIIRKKCGNNWEEISAEEVEVEN